MSSFSDTPVDIYIYIQPRSESCTAQAHYFNLRVSALLKDRAVDKDQASVHSHQ